MCDEKKDNIDAKTLDEVIQFVYQYTGITMSKSKEKLIERRLIGRMKHLQISSYPDYITRLKQDASEVQHFINAMTTNETYFFRTKKVWEYFQNYFIPSWFANHPNKKLRIWSAAAASGEEVYTIAICCEEFREKNNRFDYEILGTDISTAVLAQAKKCQYPLRSVEQFKKENQDLFQKHMRECEPGGFFSPKRLSHEKIKFSPHNLFERQADVFDIVFLRNVLIYFQRSDQEKVLNHMSCSLVNGGHLIIGESESLNGMKTNFEFLLPLIYQNRRHEDDGKRATAG